MTSRRTFRIVGQVQGVGFRPHVCRLARAHGVRGDVRNDAAGVAIRAVGAHLDAFIAAVECEAPPLARIERIEAAPLAADYAPVGFSILASAKGAARAAVTPDAALCDACRAEVADPSERRFGYAFANCTDCGPRFSIVERIPYDRVRTTMRGFAMCAACRSEYENPEDRRFHAQPIACHDCGPRLWIEPNKALCDYPDSRAAGFAFEPQARGSESCLKAIAKRYTGGDAIAQAVRVLRGGGTLGIKGLGGFHLACNALDESAVARLRKRKRRPAKPFAVMGDLATIRAHCAVSPEEAAALSGPAAPVVLLEMHKPLAPTVAPGQARLGWMLPYMPLHQMLCATMRGPLVMTSGNRSGAPQPIDNDEARRDLGGFVDAFLMHDRPIARRLDDSVVRVSLGTPRVLRRARGFAPAAMAAPDGPPVLAFGGELKGAICLTREGEAVLSHHLGDLDDPLARDAVARAVGDYTELFEHAPQALACDLHPDFFTTRFAEARAAETGLPLIRVQHHHAHAAACLAENGFEGRALAIVFDGLGLGTDGTIWGGEFLLCEGAGFERLGWLRPVPLPGGAAAQREPWRCLAAQLDAAGIGAEAHSALAGKPIAALRAMTAKGMNAPLSSAAGRLFDAVACAIGLAPERQSFEGEAAMRLEAAACSEGAPYPFTVDGPVLDPAPMWRALMADLATGVPPELLAARFHAGLAAASARHALALAAKHGARAIALSGGVMQNALFERLLVAALGSELPVLLHMQVPCNDGGLAYGQAVIAARLAGAESG